MKKHILITMVLLTVLLLTGCDTINYAVNNFFADQMSDGINYHDASGSYVLIKSGDTITGSQFTFGTLDLGTHTFGFTDEPLQFALVDAKVKVESGGIDGRLIYHFEKINSSQLISFEEAAEYVQPDVLTRGKVVSYMLPQFVTFDGEEGVYLFTPCGDDFRVYIDGILYAEYSELEDFGDCTVLFNGEMDNATAAELISKGKVQSETFFALEY